MLASIASERSTAWCLTNDELVGWPRGPLALLRPNTPIRMANLPRHAHAEGWCTTAVLIRVAGAFIWMFACCKVYPLSRQLCVICIFVVDTCIWSERDREADRGSRWVLFDPGNICHVDTKTWLCGTVVANTLVPTLEQTEEEYACQNVMLNGGIDANFQYDIPQASRMLHLYRTLADCECGSNQCYRRSRWGMHRPDRVFWLNRWYADQHLLM